MLNLVSKHLIKIWYERNNIIIDLCSVLEVRLASHSKYIFSRAGQLFLPCVHKDLIFPAGLVWILFSQSVCKNSLAHYYSDFSQRVVQVHCWNAGKTFYLSNWKYSNVRTCKFENRKKQNCNFLVYHFIAPAVLSQL